MQIISIPSKVSYSNLNTLSGYAVGVSLLVTNYTSAYCFVVQSEDTPDGTINQYPIKSGETVVLEGSGHPYWIKGNTGPIVVQNVADNIAPFSLVDLPSDVYTSTQEKFRRLRVDPGQTGLYEAREFRMVRKVSVTSGTPLVFKFICTTDFILMEQSLSCSAGDIEYFAYRSTQGTETGTYTPLVVQPIGKNISSYYREYDGGRWMTNTTLATGGGFTPTNSEAYVDYDRVKTVSATGQRISVHGDGNSTRYLAAGTYYLMLTSLDGTSVGRFSIAWEERELVV